MVGTILTTVGAFVISWEDYLVSRKMLFGDITTIFSTLVNALYAIAIKYKARGRTINMFHVQGFVRLFIFLFGMPMLLFVDVVGIEKLSIPDWNLLKILLANGLIGTVASECLYAQSIVLTTPVVASLANSLRIPLSVLADSLVTQVQFGSRYLQGTAMILVAFLIITIDWNEQQRYEQALI